MGLLFPINAAALPLYLMLSKIGVLDNPLGVALPEAAFGLPITIVILRPFMREIPGVLEDAAVVDGASRIGFFLRILHSRVHGAFHAARAGLLHLRSAPASDYTSGYSARIFLFLILVNMTGDSG